ncbi:MAG: DUF2892 domain-containing protein [Candidatus Izemoplasma sp.]
MKKNVGNTDAYIRYALGFILVVLAFVYSLWLLIPAVIMIITGYRRVCHIYSMLGKSTCGLSSKE